MSAVELIANLVQRQKERMAHCQVCEYKVQGLVYERCIKQSCRCSVTGLTLMASARCPENKWKV